MALTISQLLGQMQAGASGENPYSKGAEERKTAATKAQLQGEQQQASLNRLKDFFVQNKGVLPDGSGVSVTPEGASISKGFNPNMQHNVESKGEEGAYQKAMGQYQQSTSKIPDSLKGVQQLLESVSNPSNRTSVGAARASVLRMLGVNRYNPDEANTTVAPNAFAHAGALMQKLGLKNDADVLDPGLQTDLRNLGMGALDEINSQHDSAKKLAIARYSGSSYANPMKAQSLSDTLGQPLSDQVGIIRSKYAASPLAPGAPSPNLSPPPPAQKPPGLLDNLMSFLKPKQADAPVPQPQGTPPGAMGSPPQAKQISKKQYSKSLNQTRIVYSDGSTDTVDGLQQ